MGDPPIEGPPALPADIIVTAKDTSVTLVDFTTKLPKFGKLTFHSAGPDTSLRIDDGKPGFARATISYEEHPATAPRGDVPAEHLLEQTTTIQFPANFDRVLVFNDQTSAAVFGYEVVRRDHRYVGPPTTGGGFYPASDSTPLPVTVYKVNSVLKEAGSTEVVEQRTPIAQTYGDVRDKAVMEQHIAMVALAGRFTDAVAQEVIFKGREMDIPQPVRNAVFGVNNMLQEQVKSARQLPTGIY